MQYSTKARFKPEKICLPNTRVAILDKIFEWVASGASGSGGPQKTIFLLHGMAGTGKSTIANTVASRLYKIKRLGASFCFSHDDHNNRNAGNMFSTIARGMADLDKCFRAKLVEVIQDDYGLCTSGKFPETIVLILIASLDSPSEQYEKFLLQPMCALTGIGVVINVIDALDECDSQGRKGILEVLSKGELPENVHFIITTRPENDIMTSLQGKPHVLVQEVNEMAKESLSRDIKTYIHNQFDSAMPRICLPDSQIEQLVFQADGLFQWAATACHYICNTDQQAGANPQGRLTFILSKGTSLDNLYGAILKEKLPANNTEMESVKSVLAKVLAAAEPVSKTVLKALCTDDMEQQAVDNVIPFLGSVLTVHGSDVIHPVHTSFRDYLTDQSRSHTFFIDVQQGHQGLASASFQIMRKELQFNICRIESSYFLNSVLTENQLAHISKALLYSCCYWRNHLEQITVNNDIQDDISYFIKNQLLFWLEILSIKKAVNLAIPAMECLINTQVCNLSFYSSLS